MKRLGYVQHLYLGKQVAGAQGDPLDRLLGPIRRQHRAQRGKIRRLYEVVVESRVARAAAVDLIAPASDGHYGHVLAPCLLAHAPTGVIAAESWQADVQEHDLRSQCPGELDSRLSVV